MILSIIKTKSRWHMIQILHRSSGVARHPSSDIRCTQKLCGTISPLQQFCAERNNARREHSGHAKKPDNLMTKGK